jgi:hypothetical protein
MKVNADPLHCANLVLLRTHRLGKPGSNEEHRLLNKQCSGRRFTPLLSGSSHCGQRHAAYLV